MNTTELELSQNSSLPQLELFAYISTELPRIMALNPELIQRYNDYMELKRVIELKRAKEEQEIKERGYAGPYSPEMWAAANARYSSGIPLPKSRFPIILNDVLSLEKVRDIVGDDALVSNDVQSTTTTQYSFKEDDEDYQPQRFQYCIIEGRDKRQDLEKHFDSESVIVWFEGARRYALLAHGEKQEKHATEDENAEAKEDTE